MDSVARKLGCGCFVVVAIAGGGIGWGVKTIQDGIVPMPAGPKFFYRMDKPKLLSVVLDNLSKKGVVRDSRAIRYYARWKRIPNDVREGTYRLNPGMTADELFAALKSPVRQMVRIPETTFSWRLAPFLAEYNLGDPNEYLKLIERPEDFKGTVSMPLPSDTLEGMLYPDTYDLPPLIGAKAVIARQLRGFADKAYPVLKQSKDQRKALIIASMVEMEAKHDSERAMIAGVIENRLKQGMRLQIDATVLYGLHDWRRLTYEDYKAPSPYNTYLIDGLPPTPICSPTLRSVEAAVHPAKHQFLYYVAKPDGSHQFARTYNEHLRNVAARNRRQS